MKNLFIEYPKYSTCKNTKKFLDDNKIDYIDRNITEEVPSKVELKEWIKKSGKDIKNNYCIELFLC